MKNRSALFFAFIAILLLCSCRMEAPSEAKTVAMQTTEQKAGSTASGTAEETNMKYDFSAFSNVRITGADPARLTDDELSVLYVQARYCQAMTCSDIETMREIVSEDMTFTHMSGMKQTREEYFADIASGRLNYFTIGIK